MRAEHRFVRRVISPRSRSAFHWEQVIHAMRAIAGEESRESVAVLRAVLAFTGEVRLAPGAAAPHAMTPMDMLKSDAIQTLAKWDLRKHRGAIEAVADSTHSHSLEFIAREWLKSKR